MPADLSLAFQASVTKTATFNGAAVTAIPTGTPRRGLYCRVIYSAASNASGSNTVTFSVDVSRDGGSTWLSDFVADPITLSTTAASGEIYIHFETSKATAATNDLQFRLTATFAGAGSTPTITYQGDLVSSRP